MKLKALMFAASLATAGLVTHVSKPASEGAVIVGQARDSGKPVGLYVLGGVVVTVLFVVSPVVCASAIGATALVWIMEAGK